MASDNLQLIGDFLRHKRESLTPEVIGLSRSKRSRTPGLRRCQRQFKIDPLIDVIAEVKLTHPRN